MPLASTAAPKSIIHPYLDFWLLGGASIALWMIMKLSELFRSENLPLEQHFFQIGAAFALLSLVCNHPHFMMSYQFGYGRGSKFIFKNWFALIFVPFALLSLFVAAYFGYSSESASGPLADGFNSTLEYFGIGFRIGAQSNLGAELMGISVWVMYLTVGWHYAKQVFGCMMVNAHYQQYLLTQRQRLVIKGSLFSIALLQFASMHCGQSTNGLDLQSAGFGAQAHLTPLQLPYVFLDIALVLSTLFFVATVVFVFAANFRKNGRLPGANILVAWIAFHVWWVPFFKLPEFTFLMVPFFHSLQYLPFAYRAGTPKFKADRMYYSKITVHAVLILFVGYFAFEGLPTSLDRFFATSANTQPFFFMTVFAVFINVHHFFIDSVVWRFKDEGIGAVLGVKTVFVSKKMPHAAVVVPIICTPVKVPLESQA